MGVVAERTTDTRGLAGREPAVKARALDCGGSGAERGVVNVRDARILVLNVGGDGVRPMSRLTTGSERSFSGSSS